MADEERRNAFASSLTFADSADRIGSAGRHQPPERGRRFSGGPSLFATPFRVGYGSANALMSGPAAPKCVIVAMYSLPLTA